MAIYSEQNLQKDLAKKKIYPSYFLVGEEFWKQDTYVKKIHSVIGKKVEKEVFFSDAWGDGNFLSSLDHSSLFAQERLIVLRSMQELSSEQLQSLFEKCAFYLENKITFIGIASSIDMRKKAAQLIAKADTTLWIECKRIQNEREYTDWAYELAKEKKIKLAPEVVQSCWQRLGPSLSELNFAMEKAKLFAGNESIIRGDHISAIVSATAEEAIFSFTDAIQFGNKSKALHSLALLYEQGEEPIAIVALLARQYRWMLEIQSFVDKKQMQGWERELRIFPRLAKTLYASTQRLGRNKIINCIQNLSAADLALKSSQAPPRLVIERLAMQLMS